MEGRSGQRPIGASHNVGYEVRAFRLDLNKAGGRVWRLRLRGPGSVTRVVAPSLCHVRIDLLSFELPLTAFSVPPSYRH